MKYFGDQCKELSISCSVVKLLKTKMISKRRRQEGREGGRAWAGRRGSWLTDWLRRRSWEEQDCGQISWMHTRWPSLGNYPNNRGSCFNLQSSALENNYSVQAGGHISFTLRGQRPASNLDVNILCGLDEPSPAHARPPVKSWEELEQRAGFDDVQGSCVSSSQRIQLLPVLALLWQTQLVTS